MKLLTPAFVYAALTITPSLVAAQGSLVQYIIFEPLSCSSGPALECGDLAPDVCCFEDQFLGGAAAAGNFRQVQPDLQVSITSVQNNNACAVTIASVGNGVCEIVEPGSIIAGGIYFDSPVRRSAEMASNTTSTSSTCSTSQGPDYFLHVDEDGFTYKVDAKNEAHREGFLNATSAAERSAYVLANYEIKEPSASYTVHTTTINTAGNV
ncbi:hypothetical protein K439DRAFT_1664337 [Ramaria rubella]|nr:hypothetical protein K439DRAFT_1664337 [Ramaria rubella]